ncbi:MAG: hypothetical protein AB8I69_06820 [Anaerolineae bacterium]|jgi:hypothetical protein
MRKDIRWILFAVLTGGLGCGLYGCGEYPGETSLYYKEEYYAIDAQTLLPALEQGDTNLFALQAATPEPTQRDLPPVQWSQADYYRVAQAFHEFVWQESMDGWELSKMSFRTNCADLSYGPQRAIFTVFRITRSRKQDSRLEHTIYIEPRQNLVRGSETEIYPSQRRIASLDLVEMRISAKEALDIAESNGGKEARSAVGDDCVIDIDQDIGIKYRGWLVRYSGKGSALFWINIDTQTGEYEIIYPD